MSQTYRFATAMVLGLVVGVLADTGTRGEALAAAAPTSNATEDASRRCTPIFHICLDVTLPPYAPTLVDSPRIKDPAWFYSSLAQAAASIVGLVGAILAARLIDHLALMRGVRIDVEARIRELRNRMLYQRSRALSIKEYLDTHIAEDDALIARGATTKTISIVNAWDRWGGVAEFTVDLASHRAETAKRRADLEEAIQAYADPVGEIGALELQTRANHLRAYTMLLDAGERANHESDLANLEGRSGDLAHLRARLLPPRAHFALLTLVLLGSGAVLWPLSLLPGLDSTSKNGMLIVLAVGLAALTWYCWTLLAELKRIGQIRWE